MSSSLQQLLSNHRAALRRYLDFLEEANQRINLISRNDQDHCLERHVYPCLTYAVLERIQPGERVLDIGSGGGFPGIVNAIVFPAAHFILVEATQKKVRFLDAAIHQLGLTNVQAVWSRVENLPLATYGHFFDLATSRGVATLDQLIQWAEPYLKPGGTLEALKGIDVEDEALSLRQPSQRELKQHQVNILRLSPTDQINDRLKNLRLAVVKPCPGHEAKIML